MKNLVLIPGLNNTAAVFDGMVATAPSDINVRAVTCDALDTVEAIADALIEKLPERFWLAGFSFGGYVALAVLDRYPERVQGIALLCTAPYADTDAQKASRLQVIEKARSGAYPAMIEAQAGNAFHPDSLVNEQLMAARKAMVADYGVERFLAHMHAVMMRPDRRHLLTGAIPTLVMSASHDKVFPPEKVDEFAVHIPGVTQIRIDGAGHLAPMEKPAEVVTALRDWMQG